jgi:hypothetical protein
LPFTGDTLPGTVGLPFWQSRPVHELDVVVVVVVVVLVVPPSSPAPPEDPPDPGPEPVAVAEEVVVLDPTVVVSPPVGDVAVPLVVMLVVPVLAVPDECVLVCEAMLGVVTDLCEPPHAARPTLSASEPSRATSIDRRRPRTMQERDGRFTAGPRALRARA